MNNDDFFNFFFDRNSFQYELVEECTWNTEKYWDLEKNLLIL